MRALIAIATTAVLLGNGALAFDKSSVQQIAVIGEAGRYTFEGYAARKSLSASVIANRYAATGIIACENMQASAQLTGASNIVTTSAHLFEDEKTCAVVAKPSNCVFKITSGKQVFSYKVAARVATGFTCPNNTGIKTGDDWAILRLEKSIQGVTPYKLPSEGSVLEPDEKVVAVAGASYDFFLIDRNRRKVFPRTIEDCTVNDIRWVSGEGAFVKTDCDGAIYSSGGSLLRPLYDGDVLIGIFKGTPEDREMANEAAKMSRFNQKNYSVRDWYSIYVSVTGKFLKALESAVRY